MPIEPGQTLLHYRLIEKIGEGGMGVVWSAQDTKLGREVALKFLSASFAADADRLTRFEREARHLATLNHANIGTLHGFEEAEGERFLVLELIHGEGLDERVARGRLPLAEVVSICRQIAEALDAAHERGIFHRDLKPANIKITPESVVKVLDFGLAKTQEPEAVSGDLSASPTMTAQMTAAGVILGTAAYMSPEQARGRPTDKRTDIWSFGCILYELLTGRKAFSGETVSDHIAAILTGEPDAAGLPADMPPRLRELLARCLEKDRRRRLRDIGDARTELEKVEAGDSGTASTTSAGPSRRWLPLAVVLMAGLAIGAFLRGWQAPQAARSTRHPTRLSVVVPAELTVTSVTMSSDGESLIYRAESTDAQGGTTARLYHRRLDAFETTLVPESENTAWVTFSPDCRRIVYLTNDPDGTSTLKKVSLDGGPVVELLELSKRPGNPRGAWWSDNEIIVSLDRGRTLARLPADGGEPEEILTFEGEQLWSGIAVVHDGRTVLMGMLEALGEGLLFRVEALDLETKERRVILEDGFGGPMAEIDQFLIWRDYTWLMAPFDLERLTFTGPETPLFTNRNASVSRNGTMAYFPRLRSTSDSVVVVDREGVVEVITEVDGGEVIELHWSPDGRQIALLTSDIGSVDRRVSTLDVARGSLTPLPSGDAWKGGLSWTPAGDGLMLTQYIDNDTGIFRRGSRPGDGLESVFADGPPQDWTAGAAWSTDGSVMAFLSGEEGSPPDLWLLPAGEGAEPRPFIVSASTLASPAISPDLKWIAFISNESGAYEVYVTPLAAKDPARAMLRISDRGGSDPVWARDGSELFFEDSSGRLLAAAVKTGGGEEAFGVPEAVLDLKALGLTTNHEGSYDVSPDGSRFVFGRREGVVEGGSEIFVVLDWFAELE